MGEKEGRTMSRQELAEFLQSLSEQLRRGALEAQGRRFPVPDDLEACLEFKDKKGRLTAKLSWSWSTGGDYDRASRGRVSPGPDSLKAVKKRMSAAFKELQRLISQGAFPDDRTLSDFVDGSRSFAALAAPEWEQAVQKYLNHLANFKQAVATRQPEAMRQELQALQNCMSSCHREFKSGGGTNK
jgi:XXXCH domain-containing protein